MGRPLFLLLLLLGAPSWAWSQLPLPTEGVLVRDFQLSDPQGLLQDPSSQEILQARRGQRLSAAQLKEVAEQLTLRLKDQGYFLARVSLPAQDLSQGVVQLQLLAGTLDEIQVQGNQFYSSDFIREHVEGAVEPGRLLRQSELERKLLLLNDLSDLKVTALFQPGSQRGHSQLTLQVEDALPVHGGLGYDNFGTQFTDIHRISPHLSLGNLLSEGDSLGVSSLLGLPENRANFLQASYSLPLNHEGTRLSLAFANGASTLGQDLQILDIRGQAAIYSLQLSQALQRSLQARQDLQLSYAYKSFDNRLLGLTTAQDRYHSLRLGYSGDWNDLDGRSLLSASLTQGLAGSTLDTGLGRLRVNPHFSKLNLDLARLQNLSQPLFLLLRGSGQWSPQAVFAAEQFALGGVDSVRGYNQAQFLGDQGYSLSAELRWLPFEERRDVQLAVFVDHGAARVLQPQPGQIESESLTGAGLGLRFNLGSAAHLRLDLGWPLATPANFTPERPALYGQIHTNF